MSDLVKRLSELLLEKQIMLTTAESCTGGQIAAAITQRAGSSSVFERGFITYSNDAKMELLGVRAETLNTYGAVSEQTAKEMAGGALNNSKAQIAISTTGIAGPTGGSEEKPIGLVCFGIATQNGTVKTFKMNYDGTRNDIQTQAVTTALEQLIKTLEKTI